MIVMADGYCTQGQGGGLYAGAAKVDITPPVGIDMCGYGEGILSQGIHDQLFARVVVLSNGRISLAIVSSDLVYLWSDRVIAEVKKKWKIDHVILNASHTHAGPHYHPTAWYSSMEDKVIASIGEAANNLFPARIGAGMGPAASEYFGYNRRVVGMDGKTTMLWTNPDRKPVGPIDQNVRVMRIDDVKGNPRIILVHYACHPVTLGAENRLISADFPGPMATHVEQELGKEGNKCIAMFLQGGGGDVHPYEAGMSGERAFALVRQSGISLGNSALRVARQIGTPQDEIPAVIKVKESILKIQYREDHAKVIDAGVMSVVINNEIALAVISYEPFIQHQLDLVNKSPVKNTFLLGYSYFGKGTPLDTYLPTIQATEEGGYGAALGSCNCNVLDVGAGEKMVDQAVVDIKNLIKTSK
jgi:hypothetical protein